MTLQASGEISFSDLVGEYGGTEPHNINEYYRNGSLVPDTVVEGENTFAWNLDTDTSWFNGDSGNYVFKPAGTTTYEFYVGSVFQFDVTSNFFPFQVLFGYFDPPTALGQDYEEWSPRTQYQSDASGTYYGLRIKEYVSFQTGSETNVSVNQNVPDVGTGGEIKLSNFYGGRAS